MIVMVNNKHANSADEVVRLLFGTRLSAIHFTSKFCAQPETGLFDDAQLVLEADPRSE